MKKVEVTISNLRDKIEEFYDEKEWHFITLNGVALEDDLVEVQWIFSKYEAKEDIVVLYCQISYSQVVPSIVEIIPSAIISQRELVDMFGMDVEGSEKGLYLDEDSLQTPLRGCSL